MYSCASFWNMPGVFTTVSCAIVFHCCAALPGGSAVAWLAVGLATTSSVTAATSTSSCLFLADGLGLEPAEVMLPFIAPPL
jgi:hypothetical protein